MEMKRRNADIYESWEVPENAAIRELWETWQPTRGAWHNNRPGFVESVLQKGEGSAIPSDELVRLMGYRSVRELQKQIEKERAQGALILSSSSGGYFLPADRAEVERYILTLRRRALSTLRTLRAARQALRVCEGQEVLEG